MGSNVEKNGAPEKPIFLCPASTQVTLEQYQWLKFGRSQVNRHICYTGRYITAGDLCPPWFGSMDDKHHPGGFDEQRFQKEALKGALVVVFPWWIAVR